MARQNNVSSAVTICNRMTEMLQVGCQIIQENLPTHIQLHLIKDQGTEVPISRTIS